MKAFLACCPFLFLFSIAAGAAEPPADLRFSTYLGGEGDDQGHFVAVTPSGSVFVAGRTYPPGPYSPTNGFNSLVTGFSPDGSSIFSTGFSGGGDTSAAVSGMAVSNGRVVVGWTQYQHMGWPWGSVISVAESGGPVVEGWPQLGAWASEIHGVGAGRGGVWVSGRYWREREEDLRTVTGNFLALMNPETLATLKTVHFEDSDSCCMTFRDVAVDAAGYIYVAVEQASYVDLMKLSPDGRNVLYSFTVGRRVDHWRSSLAVDAAGRASLAWTTSSPTPVLPLTAPVQAGHGGGYDAFVVTLDPAGKVLRATFLGGAGDDFAGGLAVDRTGGLYLSGGTWSRDFPVTRPLDRSCTGDPVCGPSDAFVVHLGAPGSGVLESTLLGGSAGDSSGGVALAPTGVVAVGSTVSTDFPIANASQPTLTAGGADTFVSSLTVFNHPPDCSAAAASPSTIWPPDRRQVRISTLGVTDPDGDPVTLKVTRILQDELFNARMPDAGSLGTAKPWVRADRMDNGDGRVYHLFFEATDPAGASCTGEVKVCVPLQSGGTCRDGGARIDSTIPR